MWPFSGVRDLSTLWEGAGAPLFSSRAEVGRDREGPVTARVGARGGRPLFCAGLGVTASRPDCKTTICKTSIYFKKCQIFKPSLDGL